MKAMEKNLEILFTGGIPAATPDNMVQKISIQTLSGFFCTSRYL
jgi:hypothetical protein